MSTPVGRRVAVIPARGGSKRVPRKNVRMLDGRPLVAWAVGTCLAAGIFDQVIVTTDDAEIATAARDAGAEVPFDREEHLSDDHAPLVPVLADTLERLGITAAAAADACCVYPTAIGLQPGDLRAAWELLAGQDVHPYVVGVVRYGHPIQRALVRDEAGVLAMIDPATAQVRTQDLEPRWHDAGQFVWGRAAAWLARTSVLTDALGFELPAWRAIDLDTEDDWARAVALHPLMRERRLG